MFQYLGSFLMVLDRGLERQPVSKNGSRKRRTVKTESCDYERYALVKLLTSNYNAIYNQPMV